MVIRHIPHIHATYQYIASSIGLPSMGLPIFRQVCISVHSTAPPPVEEGVVEYEAI